MKHLALIVSLGAVVFAAVIEHNHRKKKTTRGESAGQPKGRGLVN